MNIVSSCHDYALVGVLAVVKKLLSLFQIIAPILCIISLTLIFIRLIQDPDNKKYVKQIHNCLIALFMVFFVPVFVNVLFGILGESTSLSSCWELANNVHTTATYVPIDDRGKTSILYDPSTYEEGKGKILEQLIYYSQPSYPDVPFCSGGNTVANAGCGAVSFAMIASSYVHTGYNPRVVASWFCTNKPNLSNGGLDEDAVTSSDTLSHFGLKAEVLFDKTKTQNSKNYGTSYNSAEGSRMLRAVNSGQSVMFGMPGHWAVAGPNVQCSSDKFYLYNPSRVTSNGCYTPEELFQYTYNYSNRCTNTGWCGWDTAIALSNA